MFDDLRPLMADPAQLKTLAEKMVERNTDEDAQNNRAVPAGYTYLGQFIDHDLTFDPTPLGTAAVDPYSLTNFRTPKLDLDSLYGPGPSLAPYLYSESEERLFGESEVPVHVRYRLRLGNLAASGSSRLFKPSHGADLAFDVLRLDDGTAVLPDFRNDENLLVSQMHVLFARFHNKVVDLFIPGAGAKASGGGLSKLPFRQSPSPRTQVTPHETAASFEEIREFVLRHYHWIVLHDFLPQVVDRTVLKEVISQGPRFYRPGSSPFMPVEFSAAAYRFGHSLVREKYGINGVARPSRRGDPLGQIQLRDLLAFQRPLLDEQVVDWRLFFTGTGLDAGRLNFARKINPYFAKALTELKIPGPTPLLTERNLLRGNMLGLPSGQDVARAMGYEPLTPEQIQQTEDGQAAAAGGLHVSSPLWYYILKEAQIKNEGRWLGPVASRIVAEVLVGLLLADRKSYLNSDPNWVPEPPIAQTRGELTMADIVRFTGGFLPSLVE